MGCNCGKNANVKFITSTQANKEKEIKRQERLKKELKNRKLFM